LDFLLRLISLFSVPMSLFMFYKLFKSINREQVFNQRILITSIVMASAMMFVNILFMISAFFAWCAGIWFGLLLAGLGFGYIWGKSSKLYQKNDRIMIKRSAMHLLFWASAYTLTHLLTAIFPANIAAAGLAAMFFSTGSTIGTNAYIILKKNIILKPEEIKPGIL